MPIKTVNQGRAGHMKTQTIHASNGQIITAGSRIRRVLGSIPRMFGPRRGGMPGGVRKSLTPSTMAKMVADRMWEQRDVLLHEVHNQYESQKGNHANPGGLSHKIVLQEGIVAWVRDDSCSLFSPQDERQDLGRDVAGPVRTAWKAIQAMDMLDAMGIDVDSDGLKPAEIVSLLDESVCRIFERGDPVRCAEVRQINYVIESTGNAIRRTSLDHWIDDPSPWYDLGSGVFYHPSEMHMHDRSYHLMSERMGSMCMDGKRLHRTLEDRKRSSFARALGNCPEQRPRLPVPRGNATATRIIRLCCEAVARNPDLATPDGTPVAPLVSEHLPRLMRLHAETSRMARSDEMVSIDAQLMEGIERVRAVVDQALSHAVSERSEAMRIELAFLEYRHPTRTTGQPAFPSS